MKYYFGEDIENVVEAPIVGIRYFYPGVPLRRGSSGSDVQAIQLSLNRISQNYPMIPKINPVNSIFDENTENAVQVFQRIFNLTSDGIVGAATWYQLVKTYVRIKRLGELESEGFSLFGRSLEYPGAISIGDRGEKVPILQYFLSLLSQFYFNQPYVEISGVFGEETDYVTWTNIVEVYYFPDQARPDGLCPAIFPLSAEVIRRGEQSIHLFAIQGMMKALSFEFANLGEVNATGIHDALSVTFVKRIQIYSGIAPTGDVDCATWNAIAALYEMFVSRKAVSS